MSVDTAGSIPAHGLGAPRVSPSSPRKRPVVLVLIGAFWPGHDATGPNQSFRALASALAADFEFKVVARDRPFGASKALAPSGVWVDRGFASFRYCSVTAMGWPRGLVTTLCETAHDVLMMNGFFDHEFTLPTLLMRRLGRVPRRPTILSTRGEFASGALDLKAGRKGVYLHLARRLSLLDDVWLHATGEREAADIRSQFPSPRSVLVAPNVRMLGPVPARPDGFDEAIRPLRLAFLGRVSRVKNLDYALHVLADVSVPLELDILGPAQDAVYAQECRQLAARLPSNVRVTWHGAIPNDEVPAALARCDLLFLPTRGENFGHAIVDALSAGVPVLISDQTPFQDLECLGAGWSLPLADPKAFGRAIENLARADRAHRLRMRQSARQLAERVVRDSDAVAANTAMLERSIAAHGVEKCAAR